MKAWKLGSMLVGAALAISGLAQAQQVIRVATTPPAGPPPFARPVIEAVAKDAGFQIQILEFAFGDLQQALIDKKVEVIASTFTPTPERQRIADFTQRYAFFRDVAMVPTTDTKAYRTTADFAGMVASSTRGTVYVEGLKKIATRVAEGEVAEQSLMDVDAGRAAVAIVSRPNAVYFASKYPKLKVVDSYAPPFLASDVALAVQKGDAALLAKLNASLTKLKADGTIEKLAKAAGYDYP